METTAVMARFFALLTIVADLMVVAALLSLWLTRRGRSGPAWATELRAILAEHRLFVAWAVATTATLGSLYLSEVAHFIPCKLCWYQRIAMYPLAVVLGIAAFRRDTSVRRYVVPVAAIGGAIAAYHYLLERVPDLAGSAACDPAAPCTILWIWEFGFISIPFMALSAFALIAVLLFVTPPAVRTPAPDPDIPVEAERVPETV